MEVPFALLSGGRYVGSTFFGSNRSRDTQPALLSWRTRVASCRPWSSCFLKAYRRRVPLAATNHRSWAVEWTGDGPVVAEVGIVHAPPHAVSICEVQRIGGAVEIRVGHGGKP